MKKIMMVAMLPLALLLSACSTIKVAQIEAPALVQTCSGMKSFWERVFDHDKQYYSCALFEAERGNSQYVNIEFLSLKSDVTVKCDVYWSSEPIVLSRWKKDVYRNIPYNGEKIKCEGYIRHLPDGTKMYI